MMDTRKNKSRTSRRSKRRSEQRRATADKQSKEQIIWKTREHAKRNQDMIRNRVQQYGGDEEDSDYCDSPSRTKCIEDSDSDEYDEDFDLNTPLKVEPLKAEPPNVDTTKVQHQTNRSKVAPTRSAQAARKKSISKAIHSRSYGDHIPDDASSGSFSLSSHSVRSHSLSRRYSMGSRREHSMSALTPEEAIKLVMERHSYISDSERTEDPHPALFRKASVSSSTCETAINTVGSDSGHNRTSQGKRVLALKKKKYREDTHPRTSKNNSYHQRNPQEADRQSPQQQQITRKPPATYRKEFKEENQQSSAPQVQIGTPKVEERNSSKLQSTRPTKSDTKTRKSPKPIRRRIPVKENKDLSKLQEPKRTREQGKENRENIFRDQNDAAAAFFDNLVEKDDQRIKTPMAKQSKASKNHFVQTEECEHSESEKSERELTPLASNKEDSVEKAAIVITDSDYCSDSETGRQDDDCWGGHEDDTERHRSRAVETIATLATENKMMTKGLDDTDDEIDSIVGQKQDWRSEFADDEDDSCLDLSWRTAKTSRSVLSKYSKNSSVALWMKAMEEADNDNVDQDDDIHFFDAIQEIAQTNSSKSGSTTDVDDNDNDTVENEEGNGWTGKMTNLVGYTIGALTGSNSKEDENNVDNRAVGTTQDDSPRQPVSSSDPVPPPSNGTKKVPSRELEIIKKCQAFMTSQRQLVEARERNAAKRSVEDMRLQRQEEAERAKVWREVKAYREMMEGMGKGAKLAPLDSKAAAQDYDDRLSLVKTLEDQEEKMRLHERNMMEMELEAQKGKNCCCSCTIS